MRNAQHLFQGIQKKISPENNIVTIKPPLDPHSKKLILSKVNAKDSAVSHSTTRNTHSKIGRLQLNLKRPLVPDVKLSKLFDLTQQTRRYMNHDKTPSSEYRNVEKTHDVVQPHQASMPKRNEAQISASLQNINNLKGKTEQATRQLNVSKDLPNTRSLSLLGGRPAHFSSVDSFEVLNRGRDNIIKKQKSDGIPSSHRRTSKLFHSLQKTQSIDNITTHSRLASDKQYSKTKKQFQKISFCLFSSPPTQPNSSSDEEHNNVSHSACPHHLTGEMPRDNFATHKEPSNIIDLNPFYAKHNLSMGLIFLRQKTCYVSDLARDL